MDGQDLLKSKGISIHARSIFLQGLLLESAKNWPPFFSNEFRNHHKMTLKEFSKFGISNLNIFSLNNLLETSFILSKQILSVDNIGYIFILLIPVIYICFYKKLKYTILNLFPFAPLFILNIISTISPMKDLVHQYSLFLVPFIASEVQMSLVYINNGIKVYPKWLAKRISKIILNNTP